MRMQLDGEQVNLYTRSFNKKTQDSLFSDMHQEGERRYQVGAPENN